MFLSPSAQAELLAREGLPAAFGEQIDALWGPLAGRALAERRRAGRTLVLGLCGPQGSGKSTGAQALQALLREAGAGAAILSLDDLYLGKPERARLAVEAHPLFATRGPPGTHDVGLGCPVLDALGRSGPVRLPRFDKAIDDRAPESTWPRVTGARLAIFEGWCVGARPQPAAALTAPVNALEAEDDPDGRWRKAVNDALGGGYQDLFGRIDLLALLRPPSFEAVLGWRLEQEHKLRARTGGGMTDAGIDRFIQHYERLSRWIDVDMPARADVVAQLDAARRPLSVRLG